MLLSGLGRGGVRTYEKLCYNDLLCYREEMATFACYREEIATFAMLKRRNCNICYVIVRKSQQKCSMLFGWKNVKRIVNTRVFFGIRLPYTAYTVGIGFFADFFRYMVFSVYGIPRSGIQYKVFSIRYMVLGTWFSISV